MPSVVVAPPTSAIASVDVEGFAELYQEHFQFVWRCLRGLGVAASSLEDAAQDVFVIVHQRRQSFEGAAPFRSWLFGIVRRIAYRYRRTARRKPTVTTADNEPPATDPGPLEHAQAEQAAAFVDAFTSRLDRRKREVFVLGVLEGLPITEVAETLGVPLNTAYTRLRRARADFRLALTQRSESA